MSSSQEIKEIESNLFKAIKDCNYKDVENVFKNGILFPWKFFESGGYTPLHKAAYLDSERLVNIMINEMLTRVSEYTLTKFINKPTDQEFRALHYASFRGNIEVILKLCEHGANVNSQTKKGLNVLHVAAQGDQVAAFVYFIEKYNMKLQVEDKFGSTPMHWACYTGSEKITNFILYKYSDMIDLNKQDNEGLTALHLAVMSDKLNIVKKLLYKGVDLTIKDSKGRTACEMATEKKKIDIEKTIKSFNNKNICSFSNTRISKNTSANWIIFILSHIIIEICVVLFLFPFLNDSILLQVGYITLFVLIIITFILLNFKDPGYSQKINIKMQKEKILYAIENNLKIENYCPMCLEKANDNFKHCHHCNICIKDYDHHCFWINNCVGENNIYYFLFFITLLMINIISSMIVGLNVFLLNSNSPLVIFMFNIPLDKSIKLKNIISIFVIGISILFLLPVGFTYIANITNFIRKKLKKKKTKKMELVEENYNLISTYETGFLPEGSTSEYDKFGNTK